MVRIAPFLVGAGTGFLFVRERRSRSRFARLSAAALETLLRAIDANDPETGAHVRRVARYALCLGDAAGLGDDELRSVERVALFHDIGKIHEALFDILHEGARLTPEERRAVRTHPARGAQVLASLEPFFPDLPDAVLSHHERWNGSGYPRKLRGNRIPLASRIVSISDTFDAVTHRRRYSHARSLDQAIEVLQEGRGTQFDPELVDLFLFPPVFDRIIQEMDNAHKRRKPKQSRRRRGSEAPAPEITFRWRSEGPGQRSQGQMIQKSR
jgi:HD-GYP domain-containing protein (c-di-GMP phosphodiesterase class II)